MSGVWEETEETGMGFAMWGREGGRGKKKGSAVFCIKFWVFLPIWNFMKKKGLWSCYTKRMKQLKK